MTEIVVGVDGSAEAARALAWAAREAELHGWSVTAALAWSLLDQHHPDLDAPFDPHYVEAGAAGALDAYLVRELGSVGAARVGREVICELPAPGLIAASAGARLLVVGARGQGGFRRLLLGSVSNHCLHHATVPVAIVRQVPAAGAESDDARVVVGVDGSPSSDRALAWAVDEARARHASLVVVHAWSLAAAGELVAFDVRPLEDMGRQVLDRAIEHANLAGTGQPVSGVLTFGHPASAVLDAAKGAELVIVGARGHGGFAGLLVGSVSHHIAHHADAPVIVVRSDEDA